MEKKQKKTGGDGPDLRKKAEEKLAKNPALRGDVAALDRDKLIQELRTHQIELEMQNEELRRAQSEIEEVRDRYMELYDNSPAGYFSVNGKGFIERVNRTGAAMAGREPAVLLKESFSSLLERDDRDAWYIHFKKVLGTGQKDHCEVRLAAGGMAAFVRLDSDRVPARPEIAASLQIVMTDVTGRKRAEAEKEAAVEEQRKNEDLYRRTIEALPSHIAVLDASGTIVAVNRAWIEFAAGNKAGDSPSVRPGADYLAVCRAASARQDGDAVQALEGIGKVLSGETAHFEMEYQCDSPQERRWFFMTALPLSGGGAVVSHLNISVRKRAEEQARRYAEDLRSTNADLERFNRAMVDREMRMIEIKREVNELRARLGEPALYPLGFMESEQEKP